MNLEDRLEKLKAQNLVTGIDYIWVDPATQRDLQVHFLRPPDTLLIPLVNTLTPAQIRIYSPTDAAREVEVESLAWPQPQILHIRTVRPGDFTPYILYIVDPRIDPYYNKISFDFKIGCPSDLDCEPTVPECPPEDLVDFPVDYLGRDFEGLRQNLLDFAAQRYPHWFERREADAGVMLLEVMAALGDEMAFYQDRIAHEAFLSTAKQRRSARRHAKLVDYTPNDGMGATGYLELELNEDGNLRGGTQVFALSRQGQSYGFLVGRDLRDSKTYSLRQDWNTLTPHVWDEDQPCLPRGATSTYIEGSHADALGGKNASHLLLLRAKDNTLNRSHLVKVTWAEDRYDSVLEKNITYLAWGEADALPFELDVKNLEIKGNIVPIVSGTKREAYFVTGADPRQLGFVPTNGAVERAVERCGRDGSRLYLYSLPHSDAEQLAYLLDPDNGRIEPQIMLEELQSDGSSYSSVRKWEWRQNLIDRGLATSEDDIFTLDDGYWRQVATYHRQGEKITHRDYASDQGTTIRFGDGEFGKVPAENTIFRVSYLLGAGVQFNLPAFSINHLHDPEDQFPFVKSLTNPLPTLGGEAPESIDHIRQMAPDAFKSETFRAVRLEDYAAAAEKLPWVQRAGASARWTGSWLTTFVTPDPLGTSVLSVDHRLQLEQQMDRYRLAGRDVLVAEPKYLNVDILLSLCIEPDHFAAEVKERVLWALFGRNVYAPQPAFFSPDRFTFGTRLERSSFEAHIQSVEGVKGILDIFVRERGKTKAYSPIYGALQPPKDAIIRVENNPLHPERGMVKILTLGGL